VDPVTVFRSTPGLVTDTDDFGFEYNPESSPLSSCSNVDVTNSGKIRRRGGREVWVSTTLGSAHSAFASPDRLAFVEGDALSVMDENGTVTRLRDVTESAPMSFIDDMYGRIFYTNGYEHGFIKDDVSNSWANPTPRAGPKTYRQYSPPPIGHMLGRMGSRTIMAYENYLFPSEPYNPFSFNLADLTIPIDSPARMIREVSNGVWVSTSTAIYYFNSRDPYTLDPIRRHPVPAVRGTDVEYAATQILDEVMGLGILVTAEDAILYLTDDGRVVNMTDATVDIPAGATGTAAVIDGRYITKINTYD